MLDVVFQAGTISAVGISTAQSSNNANAIANQNSVSTATCKKVGCVVFPLLHYTLKKTRHIPSFIWQVNDILNVGEVGSSVVTPITGFQLNRLLAEANAVNGLGTVDPSSTITINGKTFDGTSIEGINDGGASTTDATSENTAVRYGHLDTFTSCTAARS